MLYLILMTLCEVVLLTTVLWLRPIKYSKTLSIHIASSPQTIRISRILLPCVGVLLALWSIGTTLPIYLKVILWLMSGAFAVMGLVPYAGSQCNKRIHDFVAWGSAPIMLIIEACLMWQFGTSVGVIIIPAIILQTVALGVFFAIQASAQLDHADRSSCVLCGIYSELIRGSVCGVGWTK